jgi:hypothetical protein
MVLHGYKNRNFTLISKWDFLLIYLAPISSQKTLFLNAPFLNQRKITNFLISMSTPFEERKKNWDPI